MREGCLPRSAGGTTESDGRFKKLTMIIDQRDQADGCADDLGGESGDAVELGFCR
jgi:hypothetical protein